MQEAQAAADTGTAAIGISEDKIVVLSANDQKQPITQTASVMTLHENTSAFAVDRSVVEFCGARLPSGLNQFSIQSIVVEE